MVFLLGIVLDWRLTLYLKVEPVALFNLHHYMDVTIVCARQAFFIPSDSAEIEIGWTVCARHAFRAPSDSVETEIGWTVCAKQLFEHHQIQPKPKKDGKFAPDMLPAPNKLPAPDILPPPPILPARTTKSGLPHIKCGSPVSLNFLTSQAHCSHAGPAAHL